MPKPAPIYPEMNNGWEHLNIFHNLGGDCGIRPIPSDIRYPNFPCIWDCSKSTNTDKPCCKKNREQAAKRAEQKAAIDGWLACKNGGGEEMVEEEPEEETPGKPRGTNPKAAFDKTKVKTNNSSKVDLSLPSSASKSSSIGKIIGFSVVGLAVAAGITALIVRSRNKAA